MDRNAGSVLGTIRQLVRTPPDVQFRLAYPTELRGTMAGIGGEAAQYKLHVLEVASNGSRKEAAAVANQAYQMLYGNERLVGGIVSIKGGKAMEDIGTFYPKARV